jgi:uncharacterized membrane protein
MKSTSSHLASRIILTTTLLIFTLTAVAQQTQTARSAKKGAGWGALAGLVFGGSLWDVAGGAALGAAGGAAYGAAKGNEQQKQLQNDIAYSESQQRIRLEQERNYILADQKQAEMAGTATVVDQTNWMADRDLLNRAFGSDNVDGLFALRDCQHEKAYLHAMAGANSDMLSHRLASSWLEAMIALDQKDSKTAHRAYQQVVAQDDSVANIEQAKSETTDALVDLRADRKNLGIACKA